MRKLKQILVVISILSSSILLAQNPIKRVVLDADSHLPIASASVEITFYGDGIDTTLFTNQNGEFFIELLYDYDYYISRTYYSSLAGSIEFDGNTPQDTIFYLEPLDCDCSKIEDIAKEDAFDLTIGFDLFSPALVDADNKFKSTFSFDYAYEGKVKLANNIQLGFRYSPLKIKWMTMHSDTLITNIPHTKERYFEASTNVSLYTRFIFTTQQNNHGYRGLFLDIGAGYSLPYYFTYTYFTEEHTKTSTNHIHNFNDFQAMARIGYYWGSIKATYRFTDILTDDYIQPPKLTLGIEFNIPMN